MAVAFDFQGYIQLFLIWLISTIIVRVILTRNRKKNGHQNLLPSPPSLPIIGHLHLISSLPHQSFHSLSSRYGSIMQIYLGSLPCVVVTTPEIAKEFLKTHETTFINRFKSSAVHYLSYGSKGFLFAPYGSFWKFMKKLCMSELLGQRTLDQLLLLRKQETPQSLAEKGRSWRGHGCGNGDDAEVMRKMVKDTAELAGKFNVSDFIWLFKNWDLQGMNKRLKGILDRFDSMIERVIKEHELARKKRKEEGESDERGRVRDLLDILLEIYEDKRNDEIELSRENIKAFILDLFMAGTDTSAITIEWAFAELINNPHVMKKARQEIDSVTRRNRIIEESDLPNLPYLRAIVKETLRLHPPAPLLGRQSTEISNVCGYEIPSKSLLFINLWSMGRDPKIWENPLEFRPERFIEERQLDVRGQYFQLMPFGTGRRVCPGASLALQIVPSNLAAMIQCFEWKVDGVVSMEEKPGMTVPRAHPLICVPVPRFNVLPSIDSV
ncbi:hypothetical protein AHAS_Ahas02G0141200 [Arachis hypogaea]